MSIIRRNLDWHRAEFLTGHHIVCLLKCTECDRNDYYTTTVYIEPIKNGDTLIKGCRWCGNEYTTQIVTRIFDKRV